MKFVSIFVAYIGPIIIITQFVNSIDAFNINVKYGEVIVNGVNECTFEHRGDTYTYKSYDDNFSMKGKILFGMIEYNCENNTGVLVSYVECKPYIFCMYNELFPKCRNTKAKYILGFTFGLSVVVSVYLILRFYRHSIQSWWRSIQTQNRDKKLMKKIEKHEKLTGTTLPNVRFKEIHTKILNPEHVNKIKKKRDTFMSVRYNSIPHKASAATTKKVTTSDKKINRNQIKKMSNSLALPPPPPRIYTQFSVIQILLIFGLLISLVGGCDNKLYIKLDGRVCEENVCKDIKMASFPIQSGKSLCFIDTDNNELNIKIENSYYRAHYHHIYDTSDFELKMATISHCGWNCPENDCGLDVQNEIFKPLPNKVQGFTCETKSTCFWPCVGGYSCTYTHWWLEPTGNVARVYEYTYRIWETEINIKYKGTDKTIKLNAHKPSYQIEVVHFSVDNNLPILLEYISGTDYHQPKNVIKDDNIYYLVEASELNFPETDKIGDYQIQIEGGNRSHFYNHNEIRCQADNCRSSCQTPEPKLRRFRNSKKPNDNLFGFEYKDKHYIETKHKIRANLKIMIGNVDIANLKYEKANCDIEVVSSYGCIGCNQKPYIIIQANSIKQKGIIPFQSNCTFDQQYLSCSHEPYALEIEELDSYCYIFMPSLNKTIYIDTNIEFVRILNPSQPLTVSETPLEIAKDFFLNWDFAKAAIMTMAGSIIFGVLLGATSKLIQVCIVNQEIKRMQQNHQI
ncbi:uncharacterized protein LOC116341510 [Contarinia nasturtii]|uniref:uncharacterized protein LOC116341510 n=1 Tax=Contarinia nasturtii TaxID=265458 RepID=UPI0012D48B51|nr:uncharacterized protein LOC116341510 [Contarinia nasturtii]